MLDFMIEQSSVWQLLKQADRPIVLYGMGNGADKILDWCQAHGVQVQGVFASDEFVRGQQFRDFTVESYAAVKRRLGDNLLVVIAFASERPEVLAKFRQLAQEQLVLAPHLPLFAEKETVSLSWLEKHEASLRQVYDALADDWSRRVFANTLNYKLSGKIGYLFDCETDREQDLRDLFSWQKQECYLDLGAYNGDTLLELQRIAGGWKWAAAVEPDRRNCRKLRNLAEALESQGLPVEVHEAGIWDKQGQLGFSDSGGRQSTFAGADKLLVPVTTIDIIAGERPATYIKMDVEGAEKQALAGGRHTILTSRPKMFIAAYHYDDDLFRLPQIIWQLNPEYKIYLRKHPYVPAWELNYLAVPGQ